MCIRLLTKLFQNMQQSLTRSCITFIHVYMLFCIYNSINFHNSLYPSNPKSLTSLGKEKKGHLLISSFTYVHIQMGCRSHHRQEAASPFPIFCLLMIPCNISLMWYDVMCDLQSFQKKREMWDILTHLCTNQPTNYITRLTS